MRQTSGRTWLFRLSTIAVSLFVTLLIIEAALRVWNFTRTAPATAYPFESVCHFCAARHHCLVPNGRYLHSSYEFSYLWVNNSLGMRDCEHPLHKAQGTFRILVLGDSFIQGHGVRLEDTMVRRLDASLNQPRRTLTVEVLNAGVFGYSPLLEYLYLGEVIDVVEPDVVVVAFFLGNDVGEDYFYAQKAHISPGSQSLSFDDREWPWSPIVEALDRQPAPHAQQTVPAFSGGPSWSQLKDVLRHSQTLLRLKTSIEVLAYPGRREREFALVRERRGDIRYDLGLVNYPVFSKSERLAYWKIPQKYLENIDTLCRERRARMILLVIPPVERLKKETDFDEPYEVLDDIGRRLSVPVVQLLPSFLGEDPDTLYYKYDRHWTAAGNRLAAEVIDRELRRLNVMPEKP